MVCCSLLQSHFKLTRQLTSDIAMNCLKYLVVCAFLVYSLGQNLAAVLVKTFHGDWFVSIVHYKLFDILFITDIDLAELFRSAYAGQCFIIL